MRMKMELEHDDIEKILKDYFEAKYSQQCNVNLTATKSTYGYHETEIMRVSADIEIAS